NYYTLSSGGQITTAGSPTPDDALAGLILDLAHLDLAHRRHLLAIDSVYKNMNQVGVGIVQGGGFYHTYYTVDTASGWDGRPILTGVVYDDANGDGAYEAGEGLPGATVTVSGVGSFPVFASAGYSIPLAPGTYTVTASGRRL